MFLFICPECYHICRFSLPHLVYDEHKSGDRKYQYICPRCGTKFCFTYEELLDMQTKVSEHHEEYVKGEDLK